MGTKFSDNDLKFMSIIAKKNGFEFEISKLEDHCFFHKNGRTYTISKNMGDSGVLTMLKSIIALNVTAETNMSDYGLSDIMITEKLNKLVTR